VIRSYLPALVFLALGLGVGVAFSLLNSVLGPSRPMRESTTQPYESGLPSEVKLRVAKGEIALADALREAGLDPESIA